MQLHNKVLFIGPMGAGKTTAIQSLSDNGTAATEVQNSNRELYDKQTTTVAMDYGSIRLDDDQPVHLYGIPGQRHFAPVWPVVAKGAIGGMVLVNASQSNWQDDLLFFLESFPQLVNSGSVVVLANRCDDEQYQELSDLLDHNGYLLPVLEADPRSRDDLTLALEILIANLEVETFSND